VAHSLLSETWTSIFNRSLEKGIIPEPWRLSTVKVLYKGKGSVSSPDTHQGVALEFTLFEIFTRPINRQTELVNSQIPDEQFGFRQWKSMIHTVTNLLNDIEEVFVKMDGRKLFVIFVDISKSFVMFSINILMTKVNNLTGQRHPLTRLIWNILANNSVHINHGTCISMEIPQTNGVL
jgi:hypothetical protein